jgi:hypothetical protein
MKLYLDCHEESKGGNRTIKTFRYNDKDYVLDECIAGGVDIDGEAKGCQNFVCKIGRRKFFIYCEEEFADGELRQRYFALKKEGEHNNEK